jgi:pilus assembly protein FimV
MRGDPERLAIRTKLLEVYAKRRDTKGFELLATQLYSLTRGEGDDWAKAQELGAQIDPENPLYRPGGAPEMGTAGVGEAVEPLGASTMPQSILPSPSKFEQAMAPPPIDLGSVDLDLDLDLGNDRPPAPPPLPDSTQPFGPRGDAPLSNQDAGLDFDLPESVPPATAAAPAPAEDMNFNFGDLKFDDAPSPDTGAAAASQTMDLGAEDSDDPLSRKLELADEFRQIGDMEGARDLLQEVVAKADGALKAKAQGMLDDLA